MGVSFVVSVFLQEVRGYSAIKTGVIFTAATLGICSPRSRPSVWRRGTRNGR